MFTYGDMTETEKILYGITDKPEVDELDFSIKSSQSLYSDYMKTIEDAERLGLF